MSHGSNPTLAYLYRKYLARQLLNNVKAGRFLEIGVGSGAFYEVLESRGFRGLCLDLNPRLIEEHRSRQISSKQRIRFAAQDFFTLEETFDLVVAFEVLEHYREDTVCLRKWSEMLNPGGLLLISVPAHMRQWTSNDTRAGHARRYEKTELKTKLLEQGFQILRCWCYGFPILNWTYPLSQSLAPGTVSSPPESTATELVEGNPARSLNLPASSSQLQNSREFLANFSRTADSGTRRFGWMSCWVFHEVLWWPFLQIQKPFLSSDLGIGYLVKCQRG